MIIDVELKGFIKGKQSGNGGVDVCTCTVTSCSDVFTSWDVKFCQLFRIVSGFTSWLISSVFVLCSAVPRGETSRVGAQVV